MPFEMRKDRRKPGKWMVVEASTGAIAVVNDVAQVGLIFDDADDMVDLLNALESVTRGTTLH